jgi:hypothetical protein
VFQSHHQWFLPPTIGIRAPFVRKQKCFGRYPNFQSCQKQVLIIPQCRAHPYELTGARISFIGARGSPHAPSNDSALFDHAQPTRPEVEDECRPRAPYLSRLSRAVSRASSRADEYSREYSLCKPSRSLAAAEPIEYSTEYSRFNPANRPPYRIGF